MTNSAMTQNNFHRLSSEQLRHIAAQERAQAIRDVFRFMFSKKSIG